MVSLEDDEEDDDDDDDEDKEGVEQSLCDAADGCLRCLSDGRAGN